MAKKETELQISEKKVKEEILNVNKHIESLGVSSGKLYDILTEIQHNFDSIRGIPSKVLVEVEEIKKISSSWKNQAERIEKEYDDFKTKNAIAGVGGAVLGAGVAAFGPTMAMGVATTFGVSSTGTAISALSGAVATKAALAWLGGGALAAGGGGIASGQALLALAGPIGWTIGFVSLATVGILFFIKRKRQKRLEDILLLITKRDCATYKLASVEIQEKQLSIDKDTYELLHANNEIVSFGTEYDAMSVEQQYKLGIYVNLMMAATQNLIRPIISLVPKFSELDIDIIQKFYHPHSFANKKYKLIIYLANFIYSIDLDDNDIDILYHSLRNNKKLLFSESLKKNHFEKDLILMARTLNKYNSNKTCIQ